MRCPWARRADQSAGSREVCEANVPPFAIDLMPLRGISDPLKTLSPENLQKINHAARPDEPSRPPGRRRRPSQAAPNLPLRLIVNHSLGLTNYNPLTARRMSGQSIAFHERGAR